MTKQRLRELLTVVYTLLCAVRELLDEISSPPFRVDFSERKGAKDVVRRKHVLQGLAACVSAFRLAPRAGIPAPGPAPQMAKCRCTADELSIASPEESAEEHSSALERWCIY